MKYESLFTVHIVHDYYPDGINDDFDLVPTESCEKTLAGLGLMVKTFGSKIYVVARTEDGVAPRIEIPQDVILSFLIRVKRSDGFQVTNLPLDIANNERLLLSNHNGDLLGGIHYLYPKHPQFNAGNEYKYGDYVVNASSETYESLADHPAGTSALANADQWSKFDTKLAYADYLQSMQFTLGYPRLPVDPAASQVAVEVRSFDYTTNNYVDVLYSENLGYADPVDNVAVDLARFPEGRYEVTVNGTPYERYLDPTGAFRDHLGMVQIHGGDYVKVSHRLLDGGGNFNSPEYVIRLAPRRTLWHYKVQSDHVQSIVEKNGVVNFSSVGPLEYLSDKPLRMQQVAEVQVDVNWDDTPDLSAPSVFANVAVPDNTRLGRAVLNGTEYLVSKAFLNL